MENASFVWMEGLDFIFIQLNVDAQFTSLSTFSILSALYIAQRERKRKGLMMSEESAFQFLYVRVRMCVYERAGKRERADALSDRPVWNQSLFSQLVRIAVRVVWACVREH